MSVPIVPSEGGEAHTAEKPTPPAKSNDNVAISVDRVAEGKEFLKSVTCSICKNILWDAVFCDACLDAYCSNCMTKFTKESNGMCPCGKQFQKRAINKKLQDMLGSLKLRCLNQDCKELLQHSQVLEHAQGCPYDKVPCPNTPCSAAIFRKDLESHLKKECPNQKDDCENCKTPIKRSEKEKHDATCPLRQILCEHCKSKFVQEYAVKHAEVCPMFPVQCTICLVNVVRNEMPTHNCFVAVRKEIQKAKSQFDSNDDLKSTSALIDPQKAVVAMKKMTEKMDLVVCPECKKLAQRGNLYKCSMCNQPMCINTCLDYCHKCKRTLCRNCKVACVNCFVPLCSTCKKNNDHCYWMHFFNFEISDGAYVYIYDVKAAQIKRNKIVYPNANQELLDSVCVDRTIYISGGKKSKGDVYIAQTIGLVVANDLTVSQKDLANMNVARCLHRLVGHDLKQIFCIGGSSSKGYLSSCEVYNIRKNYWSFIASMSEARGCPTVVTVGKYIYALGGTNEHATTIEEYNIDVNMWLAYKIDDVNGWKHKGKGIGLAIDDSILLFEDDGNLYKWIYNSPDAKTTAENKITHYSAMKAQSLFVQTKPVVYNGYVYLFDNNEMQNQIVMFSLSSQNWRLTSDWGKFCC